MALFAGRLVKSRSSIGSFALLFPLDACIRPAPGESDSDLIALGECRAVAHDAAVRRLGDAVAALEHELRVEVLQVRGRGGQRALRELEAGARGQLQAARQLGVRARQGIQV